MIKIVKKLVKTMISLLSLTQAIGSKKMLLEGPYSDRYNSTCMEITNIDKRKFGERTSINNRI